ncbi:MAG: mechanosensitive ion channel family protein [Verrucomicrobia bacterium]|nr:mechanosensitive ion channel family protein [Verrucomicrobiota bacterium]
MKWRFEWLYRWALAALFVTALWSVWANAQEATTNAPAPTAAAAAETNRLEQTLLKLDQHALTFGLDRVAVLRETKVFGEPSWKYLASLIYIVLAFYVAKLLDFVIGVWLKRWAEKTETKYDDLVLELLRGPVKVVAFVIFLHIGLSVFQWPETAQKFLSRGLVVVVACSITYVALKVVDLLIGLWREKVAAAPEDGSFAEQLLPLTRKAAKITVVIAAVMLTADNLGVKITSILAGLSIGGLALGLAAQDTVANMFGAVAIFLDKPFRIGDRIKVESVDGTVENIGLRSTRIRNLDGHLVAVPNKTMGNSIITNITRRPTIRTEMNLGLTYDTSVEKVKRATGILNEVFRSHPKTTDLVISFNKFMDSALNILVVHVWSGTDAKEHFAALQELNLQIKQRFEAEGIEFAFPTQTLHIRQDAAGK